MAPDDWELYYGKAYCQFLLKNSDEAIKSALKALNLHKHESMYISDIRI